MGFKSDLVVWIITFFVVIPGILDLNTIAEEVYNPKTSISENKDNILNSLEEIINCPQTEKIRLLPVLSKEIPTDKIPLIKRIELRDNELYVILYNNISCRLGEIKDTGKKLELALKTIKSAREKGIKVKEIDVRSLKFPTIKEVKIEQ
ncbi:TPA: hypothetical protein GXX44_07910 [bacterium]|nr:hypothetical protein [bacterium]HPO82130.1 hypothetical protein [bacterium]